MATTLSVVTAALALQGAVQDPLAERQQLPPALELQIAGHLADLNDGERSLDACNRLLALGPLAVPALTAVVAGYPGGVADRQVALSVYCLGALGEHAVAAVPTILGALEIAGRSVAYGKRPEGQFYWALAHIGPYATNRAEIGERIEAGARRRYPSEDRAIALACLELGPRPHSATIVRALDSVTPTAVAALFALNQGAVARFDDVAALRDLWSMARDGSSSASAELRSVCALECAVALSGRAPESMKHEAWWSCFDHHDPTVQERAANYLVGRSSDAGGEQQRELIRRLLAMHPSVARRALLSTLAWPAAEQWVLALDLDGLERARAARPELAFAIDAALDPVLDPGTSEAERTWTDEQRRAVAEAVRSPFFALWQPRAVESVLGRLCVGTDPERGLLAAVVDALPHMGEGTLLASLAAVPALVEREPATVMAPAGDRFRVAFLERLRSIRSTDLHHCAHELASAWAALELPPGTLPGRCARALIDKVPAVRLRAAELLSDMELDGSARGSIARQLRAVLTEARVGLSYDLPGLPAFPVAFDLEDALRCAAAEGLVCHGRPADVVDALHFLLANGLASQRREAARRLSGAPEQQLRCMVTLVRHLDDSDPEVAIAAAGALGRMGEVAHEAIPDLEYELDDAADPKVREALAAALRSLRGHNER